MHRHIVLFLAAAAAASAQPTLSSLAAGALEQANLARQAVGNRDHDAALDHVKRAVATVNEIQQNAGNEPRPLMITVYREVDTTTTVTPVKHKDAELKKNSSIRGVDGETSTARLDIAGASERLQTAQSALEAGDWAAADKALGAVQDCVSVSQTAGDMPLRMVRQNLDLAKARVLEGKYHDASVPLKSAAQALGDYEKRLSGQQAADMEAARQAMLGYASSISNDKNAAAGRIDSWLDMLRQWPGAQ